MEYPTLTMQKVSSLYNLKIIQVYHFKFFTIRDKYIHFESIKITLQTLFIYLFGFFYAAFNSVQVISRRVVLCAEETSTYSRSRFCTVNCQPMVSNYQLSQIGFRFELSISEVGAPTLHSQD